MSPQLTLRRILANERSSDAKRARQEIEKLKHLWRRSSDGEFCKIGAGACGEVYQLLGAACDNVAKRAKTEEYAQQLRNDYQWHLRVLETWLRRQKDLQLDVLVPQARDLVDGHEPDGADWWNANRANFPHRAQSLPECALIAERVLPLPTGVRHSLIDIYCPETRRASARTDPGNLDCLIRPYLGKRRPERRANSTVAMFGLWNFQLYLNDMDKIGLNITDYAVSMAKSLALMHWEVRCDANDVEFVFGGARDHASGGDRAVQMWLIDFNRVRTITMDKEGISMATEAFMVNDRYYPRPLDGTAMGQELWNAFERAYLGTSKQLQRAQRAEDKIVDWEGLPEAFITEVVRAQEALLREKKEAVERDD